MRSILSHYFFLPLHHITSHHTTPHHTTSHYTTVDLQCRQGHVRHWMQQCRRSSHC